MPTTITYKYRVPGAPPDDITLKCETYNLDLREAQALHTAGQSLTLRGKEYVVLDQFPLPVQWQECHTKKHFLQC